MGRGEEKEMKRSNQKKKNQEIISIDVEKAFDTI